MGIGRVKLFIFLLLLFKWKKKTLLFAAFQNCFLFFAPSIILHFLHFLWPFAYSTRTRTRSRRRIYRSVIFHETLRATFQLGIRFNVLSFRYLYSRTNIFFLLSCLEEFLLFSIDFEKQNIVSFLFIPTRNHT